MLLSYKSWYKHEQIFISTILHQIECSDKIEAYSKVLSNCKYPTEDFAAVDIMLLKVGNVSL